MKDNYRSVCVEEIQMLQNEIKFRKEEEQLEEYVSRQIFKLENELGSYEGNLTKAVESNFVERDWNFNSISREWYNSKISLVLKNSYHS